MSPLTGLQKTNPLTANLPLAGLRQANPIQPTSPLTNLNVGGNAMTTTSAIINQPQTKVSALDVIKEIPGSAVTVGKKIFGFAKDVLQGTLRSGGSVGLTTMTPVIGTQQLTIDKNSPQWQQTVQKVLFGNEPVKSLQTRIAESEITLPKGEALPFGIKAPSGLALPGIFALAALDFTGAGGEKNVIKVLAKADDITFIAKTLREIGVVEDLIPATAKKMATIQDEKVISEALNKISEIQKTTKFASKIAPEAKIAPTTGVSPIPKELQPLAQEAQTVYRGKIEGAPRGAANMGEGIYVTPSESKARFYAGEKSGKLKGEVKKYEIIGNPKLLDKSSIEFKQIREKNLMDMTISNYEKAIGEDVKKLGYDGVKGNEHEGWVIYDKKFLQESPSPLAQEAQKYKSAEEWLGKNKIKQDSKIVWQANMDAGQKIGNKQILRKPTIEDFKKEILPRTKDGYYGKGTIEQQYKNMFVKEPDITISFIDKGNGWQVSTIDNLSALIDAYREVGNGIKNGWAMVVDNFESPIAKAVRQSNDAKGTLIDFYNQTKGISPLAQEAGKVGKTFQTINEGGVIKTVEGKPVKIVDGVDTFIHQGDNPKRTIKGFVVSEKSTGRYLGSGETEKAAITDAKNAIQNVGEAKFKKLISENKLPSQSLEAGKVITPAEKSIPKAISESAIPKNITEIPQSIPSQLSQKIPQIDEELTSLQRITNALKEAKPIRGQQEALYTQARGEKMAKAMSVTTKGEAGFHAELGQLKGELPKVQFESIRNKISQEDIDSLFNQVKDSQTLNDWDKISARGGLSKMFEGTVPTEGELTLLNRVFPKEFIDSVLEKRTLFAKIKEAGYQLANIPRSVMASFDLSAPFRQGLFLTSHPKRFFGAFGDMVKAFGSENSYKAIQESIIRKPTFDLMQESKLALTDLNVILTQREERFMSNWAEKIPIAGKVIRASGRAYTGFLNKLRADVFEDLIIKADTLGLAPRSNPQLVKEISNFVNIASGRGSLGSLQPAAAALNSFFFSPRLMASRLTLLNPVYYIKANTFVRKEAIKSLLTVAGATGTVLGLSKLAGADVSADPRSADFGKIKIGNTRIDIMGGFQQYIRMAAQLITGKYISSTTGKEITLGEGYKPLTRLDILMRQVESKEAPIFSFITDLMRGQDYQGNPIKISNEIASRFVPMAISDMTDILKDDPKLLPIGALGTIGFGVQTYAPQIKFSPEITSEVKRLQKIGLGQTSGMAGYMADYQGLSSKQNSNLQKNAESIANSKIQNLINNDSYKKLSDEQKAKIISSFVDKSKLSARVELVKELTQGLEGDALITKLSELKKSGLMTKEVFDKYQELR